MEGGNAECRQWDERTHLLSLSSVYTAVLAEALKPNDAHAPQAMNNVSTAPAMSGDQHWKCYAPDITGPCAFRESLRSLAATTATAVILVIFD